MYKVKLMNKISSVGLDYFNEDYEYGETLENEDAILLRSASLHEYEFTKNVKAIARAGAGVNNIPVEKCSEKGIVVFNTPGANANAVKELVLCALFLSSRKIVESIEWVNTLKDDENVGKTGVRETKMEDKKMAVTASMVKELREMTGAGMMDCKKALNETNGNMDEAIEYLRKNGQAKAEKKAGRIAAEGIVMAEVKDDKAAAIVEVNSETDFVAKNADFQAYVKAVVNQALTTKAANMDEFMAEAWNEDAAKTVKDVLTEKIAVIGENLNIRRFEKVETEGCVVSYIHGGGRIGVLVEADTDVVNDEIKACLKNVAMQVAAMSPKYVSRDEVDQDFLEHEKEILLAQAKKENPNKPDNIIEKMIIGRLNKEMKEICLLDQVYVQDSDLTVAKYVEKVAKENGANVAVKKFVRFETGEGLEKKNEDFAAEVAAQMGN